MKERTNELCGSLDELPDVLTPPELALALRVGVNTAYDLLRQGEIRGIRIGRKWKILKTTVLEYLQPEGDDHAGSDRHAPRR